ncbi:undecaprenyldiphospho-muramoylpentapeptide beta-N-acetylglucosaminyltransferase [Tindallia californiensis]|uniref:UDP-N-acetylglucosamine--N-acetylmuramyl-(pentapeptide) pyrophosphoryl-undecaprenol N-acetylglucosamine transferase n=1 Tax=Tindallia californiensis TaxID=159292 RepID=A0A1H3JPM2_9FIRM|nr:undecaprenyldiphospho-muramoylpentapeptide beta-N-acetylglucosaminyltransferase [Tindallia californiensis]SDY41883.1 UDP-N-acetylglucosamine-N-acetylmuramylpentapeptide N-acetylglucosamine transferase [Tindallia californiensis]
MRYIISGGGTGGHIYPAIAIAEEIKKRDAEADILFVGAKDRLECRLVPAAGYKMKVIPISYLKRKISVHNLKSAAMLMRGLVAVKKIIEEFEPDYVIGTGGYVSAPVVYVAAKKGIFTLIHEQNAYPGLTNRFLNKHVSVVALSFQEAAQYFKRKDNLTLTGNPIRAAYYTLSREKARGYFPEFENRKMVLVSGGSGGSLLINNAIISLLKKKNNLGYSFYWATGKAHYEKVIKKLEEEKIPHSMHYIAPYIDTMPEALIACDLVIGSAGAITIAEIQAANRYAVLIPKAYTAGNHQEKNAFLLEKSGQATVIKEKDLSPETLHESIVNGLQTTSNIAREVPLKLPVEQIVEKLGI